MNELTILIRDLLLDHAVLTMTILGGTIVALIGLTLSRILSDASAAQRHLVLAASLIGMVVVAAIQLVGPKMTLEILPQDPVPSMAQQEIVQPVNSATTTGRSAAVEPGAAADGGTVAAVPRADGPNLILLLYLGGVVLVLAPLVAGSLRMQWLVGRSKQVAPDELIGPLSDVPVSAHVRIMLSESVRVPLAWGWRDAVLLLPVESLGWSEEMRRDAIVHELAHLDRRDLLFQTIGRVSLALYWFNPVTWVVFRRMLLEAEQACDDRVLQSGTDRADYAERLLRIAGCAKQASLRRLPAVAMARSSQLATRIEALFEHSRTRTVVLGRARFIATILALLSPAILIGATQLDRRSPEPPPASMAVTVTPAEGDGEPWARASEDSIRLQPGSYVRVRGTGAIRFLDGRRTLAPEEGGVVLVNSRVPEVSSMVSDETIEILGPRKRDRWVVEPWHGGPFPSEGTRIYDSDSDATARIDTTAQREFFLRVNDEATEFYLLKNDGDWKDSRSESRKWDEDGDADESPLYAAIRRGDPTMVRSILDAGGDPNARWTGDGTPLIIAVRAGENEIIDLLLERGARPDLGVGGDGNALIVAASMGDIRSLREFIATGADIDRGVEGDGNPLIAAAGAGQLEAMKLLVENGADIEAVVPGDENPLIQAAENGQIEAVRYLISVGADVNARVPVKSWKTGKVEIRTPLSRALDGGYPAIASLLRSAGAVD